MNIQTKFSLNDFVYAITQCGYGRRGSRKWAQTKWTTGISGKIGKIEAEFYSDEYERKNEITYMLNSTGVGKRSATLATMHCWWQYGQK